MYAMRDMNQADLKNLLEDDLALFRQEMADVTPFTGQVVAPLASPKPLPIPRRQEETFSNMLDDLLTYSPDAMLEAGDEMSYLRPGAPKKRLRELRRRRYRFEDELDLHGLTLAEASEAVRRFIAEAYAAGNHSLLIIHGKGRRSAEEKPRLKNWLNTHLRQRNDVYAFCSAKPADGGSGAIYLLLRH